MTVKAKKHLFFWLTQLFSCIIPILVVLQKYNMIDAFLHSSPKVQVSILGTAVILGILIWKFKKIGKYVNNMEYSLAKCVLCAIIYVGPMTCILLLLIAMNRILDDLLFIFGWLVGCNIIAYAVFFPFYLKYTYVKAREDRIAEVREALK